MKIKPAAAHPPMVTTVYLLVIKQSTPIA